MTTTDSLADAISEGVLRLLHAIRETQVAEQLGPPEPPPREQRARPANQRPQTRRRQRTPVLGRRDGRLEAYCWCARKIVIVEPAVIQAGATDTCGRPECNSHILLRDA